MESARVADRPDRRRTVIVVGRAHPDRIVIHDLRDGRRTVVPNPAEEVEP